MVALNSFNVIFGFDPIFTPIPGVFRGKLFDIVGSKDKTGKSNYVQALFLNVIIKVDTLYNAFQKSTSLKADYLFIFGSSLEFWLGDELSGNDRSKLFNIAGDPSFDFSQFSKYLPKVPLLYKAIQRESPAKISSLNLFNSTHSAPSLSPKDSPSTEVITWLFGMVGDPNYIDEVVFLTGF